MYIYCTCFYSRLWARNTSVVTNIHVMLTIKMNIFQIFAIGTYTHTSPEYYSTCEIDPHISLISDSRKMRIEKFVNYAKMDERPKINFILLTAVDRELVLQKFHILHHEIIKGENSCDV